MLALTGIVLIGSGYVGSYAPALWLIYKCPLRPSVSSGVLDAYGPVEWLIDDTPANEPLFVWANWWDVGEIQVRQECARKGIWILMD